VYCFLENVETVIVWMATRCYKLVRYEAMYLNIWLLLTLYRN